MNSEGKVRAVEVDISYVVPGRLINRRLVAPGADLVNLRGWIARIYSELSNHQRKVVGNLQQGDVQPPAADAHVEAVS